MIVMTKAERLVRDIVNIEGDDVQERRVAIAEAYLDAAYLDNRRLNQTTVIEVLGDNRCGCNAASVCPLGRAGSQERCTADELTKAGHVTYRKRGMP